MRRLLFGDHSGGRQPDGGVDHTYFRLWMTRAVEGFLILTLGLMVALGIGLYNARERSDTLREQIDINTQSTAALCALRHDFERRVERTNALLAQQPGDIFGIPRELIVTGRDDQVNTIQILRKLECPPEPSEQTE